MAEKSDEKDEKDGFMLTNAKGGTLASVLVVAMLAYGSGSIHGVTVEPEYCSRCGKDLAACQAIQAQSEKDRLEMKKALDDVNTLLHTLGGHP